MPLRAYGRLRAAARRRAGLEPSAALRALEAQILVGDPALDQSGTVTWAAEPAGRAGLRAPRRRSAAAASAGRTAAYQPAIGREVAIKVIRPELADDPVFIRRFEADAERVARLDHPHIVPLYDYWREPGAAYLVTRLFRAAALTTPSAERPARRLTAAPGSSTTSARRWPSPTVTALCMAT